MDDKQITIEGQFIQCDKKNTKSSMYSKEIMEKANEAYKTKKLTEKIDTVNNENSNQPTIPNYSVFKMPLNENDRRHKEKQIAKRRHDKKLKKLQNKRKYNG